MFVGVNLGNFAQLRGGIGYLDGEARRQDRRSERVPPRAIQRRGLRGRIRVRHARRRAISRTTAAMRSSRACSCARSSASPSRSRRVERECARFEPGAGTRSGSASGTRPRSTPGRRVEAAHSLGGFLNLSGFERNSITGEHVGLARLIAYRRDRLARRVRLGVPRVRGRVRRDRQRLGGPRRHRRRPLLSGGPFVGVDTPLGPLYSPTPTARAASTRAIRSSASRAKLRSGIEGGDRTPARADRARVRSRSVFDDKVGSPRRREGGSRSDSARTSAMARIPARSLSARVRRRGHAC